MYPNGHFVHSVGPIGDLETEVQALMVEHSLAAPSFTEAQLKELPSNTPDSPWVMSDQEVAKRRDLRLVLPKLSSCFTREITFRTKHLPCFRFRYTVPDLK